MGLEWTLPLWCVHVFLQGGAAAIDAKTRTLPHGLWSLLLISSIAYSISAHGAATTVLNAAAALAAAFALIVFEIQWRRRHGTPGLGMGDIRYLGCSMVISPAAGLIGFFFGLVSMAAWALIAKQRALPLLPFAVPATIAAMLLT